MHVVTSELKDKIAPLIRMHERDAAFGDVLWLMNLAAQLATGTLPTMGGG